MDCLRSFNFQINTNANISPPNLEQWNNLAGDVFWTAKAGTSSTYNISGFKNINVHGIELIGRIDALLEAGPNPQAIVEDWDIDITLNGQRPLINGFVSAAPNYYGLNVDNLVNNSFPISKYNPRIKFASPYTSVTSIVLGETRACGYGANSVPTNLHWHFNFIVYYTYEGE